MIATWPVTEAKSSNSLALDETHHRLFDGTNNRCCLSLTRSPASKLPSSKVSPVSTTRGMTPRVSVFTPREADSLKQANRLALFTSISRETPTIMSCTRNEVSTREWQGTFRAEFNNGAYTDDDIADVFTQQITTPLHIYRNVFIPNGLYHFARHQLTYGSGQDRRFTYNFFERFGGYYGGTLNEFRVRANYRPTAKFSISASETWDRFRLPLPSENFSVVLASLQGNYSFSRFLTFTSLIQMDTSNMQAVSANLRLRYNYRPDSDLYIIYNVGTQFASIAPANPPQVRETRFAVKWTYSFAP